MQHVNTLSPPSPSLLIIQMLGLPSQSSTSITAWQWEWDMDLDSWASTVEETTRSTVDSSSEKESRGLKGPELGQRHTFSKELAPPSSSSNDIIQHPLMASLQLHKHSPPRLKCVLTPHSNYGYEKQKGWSNRRLEPPGFFVLFLKRIWLLGSEDKVRVQPASLPEKPSVPTDLRGLSSKGKASPL